MPRGFGTPSAGIGVDLFVPFVPLVPFRDDFGLGVSLGDGASCIGAGVDCASDAFSCDRLLFKVAGTSMTGAGDEAAEEDSSFVMNLFSIDGGNVNMMTLVWVLMRPLADGVDGILAMCVVVRGWYSEVAMQRDDGDGLDGTMIDGGG